MKSYNYLTDKIQKLTINIDNMKQVPTYNLIIIK